MEPNRNSLKVFFCLLSLGLSACASTPGPKKEASPTTSKGIADLELVETVPVETTLGHPELRAAHEAWLDLIRDAKKEIDIAQFYTSNKADSRLDAAISELKVAAKRGVKVRFVVDGKFSEKYPDTLNELSAIPGVSLRIFHVEPIMGGILHAKYFLVDRRIAFLGSQNFDWRSLEHIHELGVIIKDSPAVRSIQAIFDTDWLLAAGATNIPSVPMAQNFPAKATIGGKEVLITPVFSPDGWLPDPKLWDLPRLLALIDQAKSQIRVQLLSYKTHGYHGEDFPTLQEALIRAADRGVSVQLMVSHWNTGYKNLPALRELHAHSNIEVTIVTIPEWSGGFIPFARVIHAKYMVVDSIHSWIGTSNWGPGYFHTSRNLGLIVEGASFSAPLERIFEDLWQGEYAARLKTEGKYPRRKIAP